MTLSRRASAALSVAALASALAVGTAAPAAASCALPPQTSPYAFVGTVVDTGHDGRSATVRTTDGRSVEVHGGDLDVYASSVDLHFTEGATYEFHPGNDTSPFQVNICGATREIPGPDPAQGRADPGLTAIGPVPSSGWSHWSDSSVVGVAAGAAGATVLLAAGMLVWRRRKS